MPDWTYRTVLRPLLFRFPPATARDLSLTTIGALGRSRLGSLVIDFLGHMRADRRLETRVLGQVFPTAVGLGAGVDSDGIATAGLAQFGFGFVELGPVTVEPIAASTTITRDLKREAITLPDPAPNPGVAVLARRLARDSRPGLPLLARLAVAPAALPDEATRDVRRLILQLGHYVDALVLNTPRVAATAGWDDRAYCAHLQSVVQAVREIRPDQCLILCVPPEMDDSAYRRWVGPGHEAGLAGVVVDGSVPGDAGRRVLGAPARATVRDAVRRLRSQFGPDLAILAGGGVHEPVHALDLLDEGATLVAIESGLVFGGPGLPKRINDALLFADCTRRRSASAAEDERLVARDEAGRPGSSPSHGVVAFSDQRAARTHEGLMRGFAEEGETTRAPEQNWFWTLLMGLGMLVGSTLALEIAATHVVLPYDETFVGLSRAQLSAVNPRLLPFMAHDRVALAGTMMTIGILYTSLAAIGLRRGLHWAQVAVQLSASAGFASFFLFLGFGYFDPFHAFVTVVLFQFLLLMVHSRLAPPGPIPPPSLYNNRSWLLGLWGQLLHVAQAIAFVAAGTTIAIVGATEVFVPEDLEFMQTTADTLRSVSPRLVPLIAHDRASFGGMIVASGLCFLGVALWGFRRGARWVWWTLLLAGIPGYACAIGVHYVVGYENLWHLTPAFAGLTVFIIAQVLSYPYLGGSDPALLDAWHERATRRDVPSLQTATGTLP
jgi:dihydroorotate dehydrogenase